MTDHLHAYNLAVKQIRAAHARDVRAAIDAYAQGYAVLTSTRDQALYNASNAYRNAMNAAEQAYEDTLDADAAETPF